MPELPPSLAGALRPVLPDLARDTVAAIGSEVPDYARSLEGPFGKALRGGVEQALARFVDELAEPGARSDHAAAVYAGLGRGELRAGRSLDALLSAYRLGARLAWERFQAAAVAAGHPPEVLYALAGAIFTYIDAISAESVAGYAEEQSHLAGERAQRRRALAALLGADAVVPGELERLSGTAAWPLPASLAALAVVGEPDAERLASRLGTDVIAVADPDEAVTVAWIPDADAPGRHAQLAAALRGAAAALGPVGPPARGARSMRRARTALAALQAGHVVPAPLVVADDHLIALLLHGAGADEAADLADRLLAPLDALPEGQRTRALQTLRAWLDHPGQVQRVGAELHVHPQTVRYRLARLREQLGDQLEDPDARWALGLALRARG
jgi:PucR C-terminal helix-turn-helix domain